MQILKWIFYALVVFCSTAIFVTIEAYIMNIMIDPPIYYESRDWFDQPKKDLKLDHIEVNIISRNEEDFK